MRTLFVHCSLLILLQKVIKMYSKILFYDIFKGDKKELLDEIEKRDKVNIISGNPEILYSGLQDKMLRDCFTDKTALIIPDGVGTVLASKLLKNPVKEKLAGIEVMETIVEQARDKNKGIYLVGAKEEVVQKCAENLKEKYKGLNVLGYHNGYFDLEDCNEILQDIKGKKPYALFVAMGCPRQERFIWDNINEFPCKVFMGVGGSFDIFSGKLNRAPKIIINLKMEWLYRTFKEPYRIKRLAVIPKFILKVLFYKRGKKKGSVEDK